MRPSHWQPSMEVAAGNGLTEMTAGNGRGGIMATLHIEHPIKGFATAEER